MPKIDVARLNALRPQPKPSYNPPEAIRTPSDDAADPMEVDRVPVGRTLRKRKEKVAKHLKRRANEKEREIFQKRKSSGGIVRYLENFLADSRSSVQHANHFGAEYEIEYSASIETHTATSIDSAYKKSIDTPKE
ncbi:hypothetical protein DY000_02054288 [Brassica cretica]|uniref:Uncharacterized protein n=1 Tax=Brassica cretica TaxID=69181 RepID=A0ABQ7AG96_BRACR|nr:hypothetical protein DY000_02054288 [Brassica cretica]